MVYKVCSKKKKKPLNLPGETLEKAVSTWNSSP